MPGALEDEVDGLVGVLSVRCPAPPPVLAADPDGKRLGGFLARPGFGRKPWGGVRGGVGGSETLSHSSGLAAEG